MLVVECCRQIASYTQLADISEVIGPTRLLGTADAVHDLLVDQNAWAVVLPPFPYLPLQHRSHSCCHVDSPVHHASISPGVNGFRVREHRLGGTKTVTVTVTHPHTLWARASPSKVWEGAGITGGPGGPGSDDDRAVLFPKP